MTKAIAMISGGLDSILAARLIKEQGIEVIAVCFESYFFKADNARRMTAQIGIPLKVVNFSEEHLELVKHPKHGYGKNMNPCIDCHAMMMNYCGKMLDELNADFIITGEVLNQRPMSQNKSSLDIVKKESGFADKILRPLCAKNLPPTKMELDGLVDREKLLDIMGRERKIQMELAAKWNIVDYPSPAGGCKLTEPNYSKRLRDLLSHKADPAESEIELLKIGRHFRASDSVKIISTRTAEEAKEIKKFIDDSDMLFFAEQFTGSMVILRGNAEESDIELAARIAARYSKGKDEEKVMIKYGKVNHALNNRIEVVPASDDELERYMNF